MHSRPGFRIIALSAMLLAFSLKGTSQVAYHNFTSNDGLPSNEVYCVHQDKDGFLWFGTDHGVVKYNGYIFKTFTTADGLTDNTILSMKEDDSGNLWFLTLTGGLCYFDGTKFAPHPYNDTIKKLCKRIPTSYEILANKQVWLGFIDEGVAKIDTNSFEVYNMVGSANYNDTLYNYVWHLTNTRYVYFCFKNRKLNRLHPPGVRQIENCSFNTNFLPLGGINFNLLFLKDKSVLMDRLSHLIYIDSNKRAYEFEFPKNNEIVNLCQPGDNRTWMFPKNSPSYSIELANGHVNRLDSFTFSHNASNILFDKQGNYWVTTVDKGIYMVPNAKVRKYIRTDLPESPKETYLISNSKYLYVSQPEGKLLRIDKNFNAIVDVKAARGPSAISGISFNANGDPMTNLAPGLFESYQELNGYPIKILQPGKGEILIGLISGLGIINNNKVTYLSRTRGFTERVTDICHVSNQKYLIGTYTGLYYFFMSDTPKVAREPYLKDLRITSVKSLNHSVYAIASRGRGIFININKKYYNIDEQQGLVSNLAEDVYFENDSVLWVASFKGISKIYFRFTNDSLITRIKNYSQEDGLCSNQVNGVTGFNGFIWLATNEGLCYFRPEDMTEDTTLIPLYFGNISVNGEKHAPDNMALSYYENNIYIEFNALYYKSIQGIRYKFRLNGTGPWKYTNLNYIQYYSLPPGKYRFEVAADDKDGKYRSDIHVLNFVIKPRFVDTLLFKIILALIALFIAGVIITSIFSYQKIKGH